MSDDLHLSSSQYEWTLRSFYITYVLFEWMPILYTVLSASKYIASCVLVWGAIASCQALATSYESLCFLRALLGISEAAFSPGVPVFLAFFYRRDELAYRIGLFISAAPLATSFASSLAWLITKVGQGLPIAPWRMLFLVEGFPSVLISVFAFHHIPNSPGEAKYLSNRERRVAELRLRKAETKAGSSRKFEPSEIWEALKDPKWYAMIAVAGIFKAGPMWRYWGVYPAASGFFAAVTLLITWTINNQDSDAKKGTGVAILNIIGQLGPFIGTALYPESDKPYYVRGMTACAGFMLLVGKSRNDPSMCHLLIRCPRATAALSMWLRRILQKHNEAVEFSEYSVIYGEEDDDQPPGEDDKMMERTEAFRYIT
ncbi:MAG: hypothetical protein Q9198_006111 [Flavoplaca austrocitrina]